MYLLRKISVFIWFSFLYRTIDCDFKSDTTSNVISRGKNRFSDSRTQELSESQQKQLLDVLKSLPPERKQALFDEFQKQRREYERSRTKWTRLRDTLPEPDELSPVSQVEIENIRVQIRDGSAPVVRDKRTLKFLIQSLAEILGLRWTLLKYSLVVPLINSAIPPAPSAAPPAPAAPPGKPAPPGRPAAPAQPPGRLPPPRPKRPPPPPPPPPPRQPPPKPAPPQAPAAPPGKPAPAPAPARPSSPPTIPPNQIDPNTIRYPFRPAPTIPILTFAPLPQGVTVPYPPLFQWPTLQPAAAPVPAPAAPKGPPPQPPCAAPPPAARPAPPPKAPPPPSRLPLPKPRPPVPPPPKPVPQAPKGPSKTPLKLEYDHPVRIEIFNNVKSYLPVSGTVYSGNPTSASHEDENETEHYESPTQAVIQAINEQYNTEPNQENKDYDYGFYTPAHLNIDDVQSTPPRVLDYYDDHQNIESTTIPYNNFQNGNENNNYYDENQYNEELEETTTTKYNEGFVSNVYHDYDRIETTTRFNGEFGSNSYNDYPEQVEENRAHVNIKVTNRPKGKAGKKFQKKIRKPKRIASYRAEESQVKHRWGIGTTANSQKKNETAPVYGTPVSVFSTSPSRSQNRVAATIRRPTSTTTEIAPNHSKNYGRGAVRSRTHLENILPLSNEKLSYQTSKGSSGKSYTTVSRISDPKKPSSEFRIIVPSRRKRDLFFDDAFKNFKPSFQSFNEKFSAIEDVPTSTQSQFLDLHGNGQLTPNEEYREKLEKDVEKYVEHYVEQQISNGVINPNKPKTTIIELKTKTGPPIKTVTTTLSKLVEGDKDLLESILEYSKDINPVSNIGELGAESSGVDPAEPSKVSRAFLNDNFKEAFQWDFGTK